MSRYWIEIRLYSRQRAHPLHRGQVDPVETLRFAAALALTRLMDPLRFEVSAIDPLSFIVAVAVLTAVSLLTTYLPRAVPPRSTR